MNNYFEQQYINEFMEYLIKLKHYQFKKIKLNIIK